jgi:hypothetical protein
MSFKIDPFSHNLIPARSAFPSAERIQASVKKMPAGVNTMCAFNSLGLKEILSRRMPIDLKKMVPDNCRAVFLGEDHLCSTIKTFIAKNLPFFRDLGFEYFGLEALGADLWPSVFYFNKGIETETLKMHFQSRQAFELRADDYSALTEAVRKCGMKVVPLDLPLSQQNVTFHQSPGTAYQQAERDIWMADIAGTFIQDQGKIVSLVGLEHLNTRHSLPGFLSASIDNVHPVSIMIIGGMQGGNIVACHEVTRAGLQPESFLVEFDPSVLEGKPLDTLLRTIYYEKEAGKPADWILHLAENEPSRAHERANESHHFL